MVSNLRWTLARDRPAGLFEPFRQVVGRGRYQGLTFLEVEAKTIINRVRYTKYFPFEYTINCYRGCSHACVYCFARPTHDYVGLGIGQDFDSKIVVKINAAELVRAQTEPRNWAGQPIAMGTNTDPYQPAEGKYRLTRGVVEVLAERSNPFSILTKSPLVLRDRHLLADAARRTDISVNFSVGTLDTNVWKRSEPGTPHPRQRLEAVRKLKELGIPSGVLVAPLLPGLSDSPRQISQVMRACRDVGADFASPIRLHLRPGVKDHYMDWLQAEYPDLVPVYRDLFKNRSYLARRTRNTNPTRRSPKPQPSRQGKLL
jgi:DNA repair photolyase